MDMQPTRRTTESDVVRLDRRTAGRQVFGRARDKRGQSAVEFALALPVLLTVIMGVAVFGVAFSNELSLTFATSNAAQLLSISRGQTTDPCATASQAVEAAAPSLQSSQLTFKILLGTGTPVTGSSYSGTSCTGATANMIQSDDAQVTVTYPCNLEILGVNPVPNCTLTAQTTMVIQ
jgi:Flp pilus assembly protein TadG